MKGFHLYYTFIFYKENRRDKRYKSFWAYSEDEAWSLADDWAYRNGYVDFELEGIEW